MQKTKENIKTSHIAIKKGSLFKDRYMLQHKKEDKNRSELALLLSLYSY